MTRKKSTHTRKPALFLMAWGRGGVGERPSSPWGLYLGVAPAHPDLE